jgi:hypothetical protein
MNYPNLVVLHTLSKAFTMVGIHFGPAYVSTPIASFLNNPKMLKRSGHLSYQQGGPIRHMSEPQQGPRPEGRVVEGTAWR